MPDPVDVVVTTSDGVHVVCSDSGPADRTAMILLHALGERGSDWDGEVRDRLGGRFRTITVDLRGHGATDWPGDYSVALMSGDVEEVLDQLGIGGAVVVGHSLGGVVAFDLAVRRPDLVRALVAEDVAPPEARAPRPAPARPDAELPFDWDVVLALRAETDRGAPLLWDALDEVAVPVLIVAGGPTSTVDQGRLAQAATRLPNGSLYALDAGHYVHRERPSDFVDLVLAWLDEVGV